MKKVFKLFIALCLALTTLAPAALAQAATPSLSAKSAVAIDAKTGQVLYAKNPQQARPIASITKLLTVYLTVKAIKQGKLSWHQRVTAPAAAIENTKHPAFTNVPLHKGHRYTIRQLYQATLMASANGAAMTLGQAVAGSQHAFVVQMRQQARAWGMKNAQFYTACGLSNGDVGSARWSSVSAKAENKLSALNVAFIARKLLKIDPQITQTTRQTSMVFNDRDQKTRMTTLNQMLPGQAYYQADLHVDGLKTGTTDGAGQCFVSTTWLGSRRIICVVLGSNGHKNELQRFVDTTNLLHYVQNNYQPVTLTANKMAGHAQVEKGKAQTVKFTTKQKHVYWDQLDGHQLSFKLPAVKAPVQKGSYLGTAAAATGSTQLRKMSGAENMTTMRVKLYASQYVAKRGFWAWLRGLF